MVAGSDFSPVEWGRRALEAGTLCSSPRRAIKGPVSSGRSLPSRGSVSLAVKWDIGILNGPPALRVYDYCGDRDSEVDWFIGRFI